MPKSRPTSDDDLAARSRAALQRVLARERDPRARRWLAGLLAGDDAKVKEKKPRKKRAA